MRGGLFHRKGRKERKGGERPVSGFSLLVAGICGVRAPKKGIHAPYFFVGKLLILWDRLTS